MSDHPTTCASCGNTSKSAKPRGWKAIIRTGGQDGWTCPECPSAGLAGEPIWRQERNGKVTFRVILDRQKDPITGKRRQVNRVYPTLADAKDGVEVLRAEIAELDEHESAYGGPSASKNLTVNGLFDMWLEFKRGEVRDVTHETYTNALKPVRRRFGDRRVKSITRADVQSLQRWLAESGGASEQPLGKHAARASMVTFKATLAYAVFDVKVITKDPSAGIKVRKVKTTSNTAGASKMEQWTLDEWEKFVAHVEGDPHEGAWRLAVLGLRREEILGLRWSDVDFAAGTVSINQTRVAVSSATDPRRWMIGEVKTADTEQNASLRTLSPDLPLPGTMDALRAMQRASLPHAPEVNPDGLVVVDEIGKPVMPSWFTSRFQRLSGEAGVTVIKLHSTRNTWAILMHEAGQAPAAGARWLGHTVEVHIKVYLKGRDDDIDRVGAAMGAYLARTAAAE